MDIKTISKVIGVADMARAVGFYRDALGLAVLRETAAWTDLTCGDGNLALQVHAPPTDDAPVHTGVLFTLDGTLDAAIAAVENAGGRLLRVSDHAGAPVIVAHVADTEGNAIQLVQPR